MAGEWMPLRHDIYDDPAVVNISMELGIDPPSVVGKLSIIWVWFSKHTEDGIANVKAAWLDRIACTEGFCEAMQNAGWLLMNGDRIEMPRFETWLSDGAKKRLKNTRRQQRLRTTDDGSSTSVSGSESVAPTSRSERDKSATTGQDRTGQNRNSPERIPVPESSPDRPAAGKSADGGQPGSMSPGSVFRRLTVGQLHDPEAVLRWLHWQSSQPGAVIRGPTKDDEDWILEQASRAVGKDKPLSWFVAVVGRSSGNRGRSSSGKSSVPATVPGASESRLETGERVQKSAELKTRNRQAYEALEREFGAVLDAMPRNELFALADRTSSLISKEVRNRGGPTGKSVRQGLFSQLRKEQARDSA